MEQNLPRDKYPKAKIEELNLRLPKALVKPDGDPTDDLAYMKIFEDDTRRAKHLGEAIAGGAKLDRKVYRVRNKELVKFIGKDFEGMSEIHRATKATIGILADGESNLHSHSYLDLVGTIEEVSVAEGLILDNILKTYSTLAYPVILMPPTIYGDHIVIPVQKVINVLGTYGTNILRMEMESGAWIKIEPGAPPGGLERERLINVFGPRDHVIKAIKLIRAVTYEPTEPSIAQAELWREFNEPCWRDFFECKEVEESKLNESGEPDKVQQHAEEGGYGVTEKERNQEHVEEALGDEESEKKKSKKPSWNQLLERKKYVSVESEKKFKERKTIIRIKKSGGEGSKQTENGSEKEKTQHERTCSQTFLRKKSLSEGSKRTKGESRKKKHEFKEPGWSETFRRMNNGGGESSELGKGKQHGKEGGSDVTKIEKHEEHDDKEAEGDELKEKSQEYIAKNNEYEDEKEGGDESKDKRQEDMEYKDECDQESVG